MGRKGPHTLGFVVASAFLAASVAHAAGVAGSSNTAFTFKDASGIAEERAHAHSRERCWHYVKEALLASGAVNSYPKTAYAKEAAQELVSSYGFKKLPVRDPFKAPVGSVLVYGDKKAAGHVEIRPRDGFVSDFKSKIPSPRPLIGVFTKS